MTTRINWHRLFGLTLTDFFTGSNYQVNLEKELSVKKQYLDVVILEQSQGQPILKLPDGLENLAAHNLLTYKSLQESFNEWTIEELIGHYVNYRKQISPSIDDLLPVTDFQLYGVSTRYPENLPDEIIKKSDKTGVYDIQLGIRSIRLIVLSRIPKTKKNALWHLFSGKADKFVFGNQHYHWRYSKQKTVLKQLYKLYQLEEVTMSYTFEDFERDFTREHLHLLTVEDWLKILPMNELLKRMPADDLLKRVPVEERLKGVSIEDRFKGVSIEDRFKGIPREVIEDYLSKDKSK
jgi:hypothetical protein